MRLRPGRAGSCFRPQSQSYPRILLGLACALLLRSGDGVHFVPLQISRRSDEINIMEQTSNLLCLAAATLEMDIGDHGTYAVVNCIVRVLSKGARMAAEGLVALYHSCHLLTMTCRLDYSILSTQHPSQDTPPNTSFPRYPSSTIPKQSHNISSSLQRSSAPDNPQEMQEEVDDVQVEVDGGEVSIIEGVLVLAAADDELRVEYDVDAEEQRPQAGVDQLGDRVFPEEQRHSEAHQNQQEHEQVRSSPREVRLRAPCILPYVQAQMVRPTTSTEVIATAISTLSLLQMLIDMATSMLIRTVKMRKRGSAHLRKTYVQQAITRVTTIRSTEMMITAAVEPNVFRKPSLLQPMQPMAAVMSSWMVTRVQTFLINPVRAFSSSPDPSPPLQYQPSQSLFDSRAGLPMAPRAKAEAGSGSHINYHRGCC